MKKLIPLLLLLFPFIPVKAQLLSQLSGTVTDKNTRPIANATVYFLNTNYTSNTSEAGSFKFKNIIPGDYIIHISAVGYAAINKKISVKVSSDAILNIQLNESDIQLSEVVVTAQKQQDDPQHVPVSITELSANQVKDAQLWDANELTAVVPNLYSANSGDNRNVTSIRGITTTSYDPAVATYIDGVNQYGLDTYISQLFDIDRIEVLRGPQGTLYGRNAMGGVINIITKQPGNTFSGFAGVDVGNYGEQRYTFGFNAPLAKDKLYFGAAGQFSALNGYYTNAFYDNHFDAQHYFLGNYYLKYLPTNRLAITLNFKNYENRNNGAFPLVASTADALSKPFVVDQNAVTTMIDNTLQGSLTVFYTGRDFTFTSQSSYQENYRIYNNPIDGDFSPIDGITIVNNYGSNYNRVQTGIQEFKFSSPASSKSPLKWTAGTYGFLHYSPDKQGTHFGADAAAEGSPQTDFTSINTNIGHNYGIAAYGQLTYALSSKWDAVAGIRYDYEHQTLTVSGAYQPDGQAAIVTQPDTAGKVSFSAITPKFSLDYHVAQNNVLYATYSKGFRTGGISELGSDPTQPPLYGYKPEYSNNYEAGIKNSFLNNRIRLNATLFYTLVSDAQVPTLLLPQALTVTKNAGNLNSKGAELEFAAVIIKGLEIDYNAGYTHARYTDLLLSNNGAAVNLKGNQQVFTPDVTSMLALQYSYDLNTATGVKLVARTEWRYIGDQYFDLANLDEQKAYSLFNARLGATTKRYSLFLWGKNIANKHYVDYAYDFGAAHLGNPATYGVSLEVKF